ncbi:MAG: C40 family peptidase, partial [Candidatus Sericytochromatia bacterium]|nr:C40 family peptidase [Candidatus Sericytochromatia bacterium]
DPLFGTQRVTDGRMQALRGTATTSLQMLAHLPTAAPVPLDARQLVASRLQSSVTLLAHQGRLTPVQAATLQRIAADPTLSAERLRFIASALSQLGKPYNWGSTGPKQFDCSGLTSSTMKNELGKAIPRTAAYQARSGVPVLKSDLKAGDLLFFGGSRITHVAIYLGDGLMLESGGEGRKATNEGSVRIRSIRGDFKSARRYLPDNGQPLPNPAFGETLSRTLFDNRPVQSILSWFNR